MRGQTLFWVHYKLVIELLKHSHFLTNYMKNQILASCNNLRIEQDSEFAKGIDNIKIDHALTFEMLLKRFYRDWESLCNIIRVKSVPLSQNGQNRVFRPFL